MALPQFEREKKSYTPCKYSSKGLECFSFTQDGEMSSKSIMKMNVELDKSISKNFYVLIGLVKRKPSSERFLTKMSKIHVVALAWKGAITSCLG